MERGSLDHLLFLTLTVSLDYQRDASLPRSSARCTYEDTHTRYLFDLVALSRSSLERIRTDLRRYRLSLRPQKDALVWSASGNMFQDYWGDDPMRLLAA